MYQWTNLRDPGPCREGGAILEGFEQRLGVGVVIACQRSFNVKDWLKFAEAKNAALPVADSAAALALLRILWTTPNMDPALVAGLSVAVALLLCSLRLCLGSFLPVLDSPILKQRSSQPDRVNYLFFRCLAFVTVEELLEVVGESVGDVSPDRLSRDYAAQIITNSKIASVASSGLRKARTLDRLRGMACPPPIDPTRAQQSNRWS